MSPLQVIDSNTAPPSHLVGVRRLENSGELVFDESSSSTVNDSSSQDVSLQPTGRYDFGHVLSSMSDEEEMSVPTPRIVREDPSSGEFETYGIHGARWGR